MKDYGGPAFPYSGISGMSLRDWFASQALMGMLSNPESIAAPDAAFAEWAYGHADAMLAERDK
jgi:hypothetical protein